MYDYPLPSQSTHLKDPKTLQVYFLYLVSLNTWVCMYVQNLVEQPFSCALSTPHQNKDLEAGHFSVSICMYNSTPVITSQDTFFCPRLDKVHCAFLSFLIELVCYAYVVPCTIHPPYPLPPLPPTQTFKGSRETMSPELSKLPSPTGFPLSSESQHINGRSNN